MICSNCGADNRESAKFCIKCAKQLVPLWPATVQMDESTARKRRRKRRSGSADASDAQAPDGPRLGLYLFAGLLLAAVTAWAAYSITSQMSSHQDAPVVAAATSPAEPASAALAEPAPMPPPAVVATPEPPAASALPEPAAHAHLPAPAADTATSRSDTKARPRPTSTAVKPGAARQAASAPRPAGPAVEPEPVAPPPAPAPAPRPAAATETVALCADSRFIAHSVCLQRECARPGMRQHPQCARMREQQQALHDGSGDR